MNVKSKLSRILNRPSFGDLPNKERLLEGYEELKKLVDTSFSIEFFTETIKQLKANPFYQQFKLDTDPSIFKVIVNKVDDISILESLLDLSLEIAYSKQEKAILEQRLCVLILLSILNDDLKKMVQLDEKESGDGDNQSDFFEIYFEDFSELKAIFSSERVTPEHVSWFFDSDLFELIAGASDYFDIELEDCYELLLDNAEINTKKDFMEHKSVLMEKYEKSKAEKEPFNYDAFCSILNDLKKNLISSIKRLADPLNPNVFYKLPKAATLSPIARDALINNLKKYVNPSY